MKAHSGVKNAYAGQALHNSTENIVYKLFLKARDQNFPKNTESRC
jgi:hypothetical protein